MRLFRKRARAETPTDSDPTAEDSEPDFDYGEPPEDISESIAATAAIESTDDE